MKQVLALFSKYPKAGFSKTRLGEELGHHNAENFTRAFLRDFIDRFKNLENSVPLHFEITPKTKQARDYFKRFHAAASVDFQEEIPFFDRLKNLFQKFDPETFIHLTGSDIPDFPFEILNESNEDADVFIGPDLDGGFYYLGTKAKHANVFNLLNVQDGEVTVYDSLVRECEKLNLKVKVLKEWSDIDTEDDLIRCLKRNSLNKIRHTFEVYSSLRGS